MSVMSAGLRRTRVGAVVAAVLLGVGLAGCGSGSAEPSPLNQSEGEGQQKKSGQEQAGDEQPEKPADPEEYAFVKEYVDAINEVKKGGGSSKLLEMSTEDCQSCDYMAQYHEDVYDAGGKYVGDPSIKVIGLVDGPAGSDPTILRVETKEPEIDIIEESGEPALPLQAGNLLNDFELSKEGGQWKVSAFCEVTESQPSGCATQ